MRAADSGGGQNHYRQAEQEREPDAAARALIRRTTEGHLAQAAKVLPAPRRLGTPNPILLDVDSHQHLPCDTDGWAQCKLMIDRKAVFSAIRTCRTTLLARPSPQVKCRITARAS